MSPEFIVSGSNYMLSGSIGFRQIRLDFAGFKRVLARFKRFHSGSII
jgi:hypothetical protein